MYGGHLFIMYAFTLLIDILQMTSQAPNQHIMVITDKLTKLFFFLIELYSFTRNDLLYKGRRQNHWL